MSTVTSTSLPANSNIGRFPVGDGSTDMMSGPRFRSSTNLTRSGSRREPLRLTLKPKRASMGMVDGAWWPRSNDPYAEFPAMIAGIETRLGRPDRVAFNVNAWADAPRHLVVDRQAVRLEGFNSLDEHTVVVSGDGWHRMVLVVVPPEAGESAAVAALARAAAPDNTEQAVQILSRTGAHPGLSGVTVPAARRIATIRLPRVALPTGAWTTS
jgi:uncharacterized protein DUF5994